MFRRQRECPLQKRVVDGLNIKNCAIAYDSAEALRWLSLRWPGYHGALEWREIRSVNFVSLVHRRLQVPHTARKRKSSSQQRCDNNGRDSDEYRQLLIIAQPLCAEAETMFGTAEQVRDYIVDSWRYQDDHDAQLERYQLLLYIPTRAFCTVHISSSHAVMPILTRTLLPAIA